MNELHRQFVADAEGLIESLFSALQQLRARRAEGKARRELTGQIFRQVHTLKGSAAAAEVESIAEVAHEFENVLDAVRLGRVSIDDAVLDAFEDAAHAISEDLAAPDPKQPPMPAGDLIQRLRRVAKSSSREESLPVIESRSLLPADLARALSKYDEQHLREAVTEGARLFVVSANFSITTFDQEFRKLSERLSAGGELVATVPTPQTSSPGEINFRILYATVADAREIAMQIGATKDVTISEIKFERNEKAPGIPDSSAKVLPSESEAAVPEAPTAATVRVNLAELDDLIARASELFRDTTNSLELAALDLRIGVSDSETGSQLSRIKKLFLELEDRLIRLRMVPLAQTFERAARAGRIAARGTGKEVNIEIAGSEVAIDKSLADTISDPLMHLVRNAVDHGIELPDHRVAVGKKARGRIRLTALAESNRIQIYVEDDGRGIDSAQVARAAADLEIIDNPAQVTMEQCLRLIFRPGFSTTTAVSETSGRGIGLEIVDRAMEEVGGEVRVRTEPGHGTTFQMILPATLALVPSVLVQAGDNLYSIDARHVVHSGPLNQLQTEPDRPTESLADKVKWRDKEMLLADLRELLGHGNGPVDPDSMSFLIVRLWLGDELSAGVEPEGGWRGNEYVALAVSSIQGEHQALVRSLGRHGARWRGVAGATELRDGSVALVLDLPQLFEERGEGAKGQNGKKTKDRKTPYLFSPRN
jgi:two-component system, chemotaxis family, sensor kinase CheA